MTEADPPSDDGRMTLWEHLAELRTRLMKSVGAVAIGSVVGWFLYPYVLDFLVAPYRKVVPTGEIIVTDLLQGFFIRIETSFYLGVVFAMPVLLWQIWRFVTPGLYPQEKKYAVPFIISALVLFLFGATVAYLILPPAIDFLVEVAGPEIKSMPTIDSYLKLNLFMMLAFGAGFEFPVLLVALELIGVISYRKLNSWRRTAIVVIVVVAAVITPSGDPISLMALAIPMYLFYEVSILLGWMLTRKRAKPEETGAA